MKFILTCILSVFLSNAFAHTGNGISVMPGKDASLILRFESVSEKAVQAIIVIHDTEGKLISEKNISALHGENLVTIGNAGMMNEGNYTIQVILGTKTLKTNFTIWK